MSIVKYKWAMVTRGDEVLDYTLSDSADAAIKALSTQLGGRRSETYEDMVGTGFTLARVRVTMDIVRSNSAD
jgi:hypothetical protein